MERLFLAAIIEVTEKQNCFINLPLAIIGIKYIL